MMSRGGNTPGHRGRSPINFNFYGGFRGFYESGLTPIALDEEGTVFKTDASGVQFEAGAFGAHRFSRGVIGVDYRGDYRQSIGPARNKQFNGTNQAISLDLQWEPSKNWLFNVRETGGSTNRAFGGFAAPAFADISNLGVPLDEVFDSRVYYSQTSGTAAYRWSARTTFAGIGEAMIIKRPDPRLVSGTGLRAMGIINHQFDRRNQVAINYSYFDVKYRRVYGAGHVHGISAQWRRTISRNLLVSVLGGTYHMEATGTQTVVLSPEVAALLGRSRGVEAFHRISWGRQAEVSATYRLEQSSFNVGFTSSVTPGNGVYLLSARDALTGGYSYAGVRRMSIGLSGGWTRVQSRSIEIGDLKSVRVGGGLNYRIVPNLNLSGQVDQRWYQSPGLTGRNGISASLGVTVSPTNIPLPIW